MLQPARTVARLGWRDDGRRGRSVRLWDAETGREIRKFAKHTAGVFGVAFSPDGRWLASGATGLERSVVDATGASPVWPC